MAPGQQTCATDVPPTHRAEEKECAVGVLGDPQTIGLGSVIYFQRLGYVTVPGCHLDV